MSSPDVTVATRKTTKSVRRAAVQVRAFGGEDADMLRMELRTLKATVGLKEDPTEARRRIAEIEAAISGGAAPAPAAGGFGAPAPAYAAPAPSAGVASDSGAYGLEVRCNPTQPSSANIFPDAYVAPGGSSFGAAPAAGGWAPPADTYSAPEPASFGAPAASFGAPAAAPAGIPASTAGMDETELMMLRCELKSAKAQASVAENPADAQARVAALEKLLMVSAY